MTRDDSAVYGLLANKTGHHGFSVELELQKSKLPAAFHPGTLSPLVFSNTYKNKPPCALLVPSPGSVSTRAASISPLPEPTEK